MKTPITSHQTTGRDELLVHSWRVERLTGLGIPGTLAEAYAGHLDWHQVARLVQCGCTPAARLAHHPLMSAPANRRQDAAARRADPALFFPAGTTDKAHPTAGRHTGGRTDGGASRTADHSPAWTR